MLDLFFHIQSKTLSQPLATRATMTAVEWILQNPMSPTDSKPPTHWEQKIKILSFPITDNHSFSGSL